jgi:hypothetical protein
MEHCKVILSNDEEFDKAIRTQEVGLPVLSDGGDLTMITKDHGTTEGRPVVMLTFSVQQTDGSFAKAQTVITGRQFQALSAAFRGRYGEID